MKINRYKLRPHITKEDLIKYKFREGGSWIIDDADMFVSKCFEFKGFEFSICIGINSDTMEFNDFDNVIIIDEDFGQPYTPFYGDNYGKEIAGFYYLEETIKRYNQWMDSLEFLERVEE